MGKSHFKIAADLVVDHCKEHGYANPDGSDFYWAYRWFFEAVSDTFDADKFYEYIKKRV
jgi:hypothetical protein